MREILGIYFGVYRVRIKIRIRVKVRVRVTFNVGVYRWSNVAGANVEHSFCYIGEDNDQILRLVLEKS